MTQHVPYADFHIAQIFGTRAARTGGVVRRKITWARREIGHDRLVQEVTQRGFHMITCGGQYVIICDRALLEFIC